MSSLKTFASMIRPTAATERARKFLTLKNHFRTLFVSLSTGGETKFHILNCSNSSLAFQAEWRSIKSTISQKDRPTNLNTSLKELWCSLAPIIKLSLKRRAKEAGAGNFMMIRMWSRLEHMIEFLIFSWIKQYNQLIWSLKRSRKRIVILIKMISLMVAILTVLTTKQSNVKKTSTIFTNNSASSSKWIPAPDPKPKLVPLHQPNSLRQTEAAPSPVTLLKTSMTSRKNTLSKTFSFMNADNAKNSSCSTARHVHIVNKRIITTIIKLSFHLH